MDKIRKYLTLAGLTLASILPAKAQAEDFYVNNMQELDTALDYNQSSAAEVHAYLSNETFQFDGIRILENDFIHGQNNPVPQIPLDESGNLLPPNTSAEIEGTFVLRSNSGVDNVIIKDVHGMNMVLQGAPLTNVNVENCYFEPNNDEYACVMGRAMEFGDVTLTGNVFQATEGWGFGLTFATEQGSPKLRNNLFYGCDVGVRLANLSRIDAGTITDRGENVFTRNRLNGKLETLVENGLTATSNEVPLQYNFWYDENGNQLTDEGDILGTFDITGTNRNSLNDLEVTPFYSSEPFQQRAMFSEFQTANSQLDGWNGILIWDEKEGLVGWQNGFGRQAMYYEFDSDSWKWKNFYDFQTGNWNDQEVELRKRIVDQNEIPNIGLTPGYKICGKGVSWANVHDYGIGENEVTQGGGNWTIEVPKSDSFIGIGIYCPVYEGWTDVVYTK